MRVVSQNVRRIGAACLSVLFVLLLHDSHVAAIASAKAKAAGVADVNGTRLAYEMRGRGPTVVLIHGGLVDSRLWDDQFREFAKHYRVIRYDLRGFGKSAPKIAPFSHIEDLYALLKFLKVEKASLVGLSLGGMIAVDFALEHPEMVDSLVLTSSGLRGYQGPPNEKSRAVYKAAAEQGTAKAIELWLEHPFFVTGQKIPRYEQRVRAMLADNVQSWGPESVKIPWTWPTAPSIDRLGAVRAPTLIVVGDQDAPTILAIADVLKDKIPNSRKVVIGGTSHHLNMEKPKEFNKIVMGFLPKK